MACLSALALAADEKNDEKMTKPALPSLQIAGAKCYSHVIEDGPRERVFGRPDHQCPHEQTPQQPTPTHMNFFPAFYTIAYDLHEPDKNCSKLDAKMALFRERFKILESTWLVKTKLDSTAILKRFSTALASNDHVFIAKIDLASCDGWLPLDARVWLEKKTAGF